jgi:hypothetical protein
MRARRTYKPLDRPLPKGTGRKPNAVYARRDYSLRWSRPAHGQPSGVQLSSRAP